MKPKRPSIPMQVQAFRRQRSRPLWPWALAATLIALLLIWLVSRTPGESSEQPPLPASTVQVVGPPWQMGNPEGRFVLTFYADLECPFCRDYFPLLKRWVGDNKDVALQWHHQPLVAHEPAASAGARLAECAAEAGGHAAFWQAIEWVYAHTRSAGQGVPDGLRYSGPTPAFEQCIKSERPDTIIRAQATEATNSGVTATPSLRLQDRHTGRAILLQGPIEGDALLSAMDMLTSHSEQVDTP
ncbi:thioredoxin domain-containing protein [Pseudomonas aeruginosa]|uniref:DsbA family protein n=1 Tax=Pseudomonas aeruginosa TaxID=287 RepID=UPI00287BBCF2|nr:thioredoxin domain-containing protein [Pseudomonas aeruginosa]